METTCYLSYIPIYGRDRLKDGTVCQERHFRAQSAIEDRLLVVKGDKEVNSNIEPSQDTVLAIERYNPKACMLQYLSMHMQ